MLPLSISSLARDHANAIYLSHFRRYGIILSPFRLRFSTFSFAKNDFPYVSPFGSFPIFTRLRIRSTSINLREAHYGYLFLFSFLSLAYFNIPPINRSVSSNPPVSHYPHLNFVQNAPFFSLDYVLVEFSSVQARRGYKFALIPCFLSLFLFLSVSFSVSHLSTPPHSVPIVTFLSTAVP